MKRANTVMGLDIGHHAVKAVVVDRRGSHRVVKAVSLRTTTDQVDRVDLIASWLEQEGLTRIPCVLAMPGSSCVFQPMHLPAEDPRTIDAAAAMEVVRFNDIASEAMVYDHAAIDLEPDSRHFILAMARTTLVQNQLELADRLGLSVIDVVSSPVALFAAHGKAAADADETRLFIDVGRSGTQVAIGSKAGLLFARAFASGGQAFTDSLARVTKATYVDAEGHKVRGVSGEQELAAIESGARAWVAEVQSCLSLHRNVIADPEAQPTRIMLSGGGARLPAMADVLRDTFDQPVEMPDSDVDGDAPEYAIARGLARCGVRAAAVTLSLLPVPVRDNLLFREQKPFWIASGVTMGLILAVTLVGGYYDQVRKEKHLRQQRQSLARRQELVHEVQSIQAANLAMRKLASPVGELLSGGAVIRDIITLVSQHLESDDWLTVVCDGPTYFGGMPEPEEDTVGRVKVRRRPATESADELERFRRIIIEGNTPTSSLATVKALIAQMNESPLIESADLLNDDQLAQRSASGIRSTRGARPFAIDVWINPL